MAEHDAEVITSQDLDEGKEDDYHSMADIVSHDSSSVTTYHRKKRLKTDTSGGGEFSDSMVSSLVRDISLNQSDEANASGDMEEMVGEMEAGFGTSLLVAGDNLLEKLESDRMEIHPNMKDAVSSSSLLTDEVNLAVLSNDGPQQMLQSPVEGGSTGNFRRKLLVLDVNGLLVDIVSHASEGYNPDTFISGKAAFKRPFCDDFLQFCFERFHVGIWSSRTKKNLDWVVTFLMEKFKGDLLFCWDQSHCTNTGYGTVENKDKPLVLKELKKLWEKQEPNLPWEMGEYNESNTLLLDDSPYKALRNPPHTAIFPNTYQYKDLKDNSLGPGGDLRVYLEGLASADNVQKYVELNPFGQKPITESNLSWNFYLKILGTTSSLPEEDNVTNNSSASQQKLEAPPNVGGVVFDSQRPMDALPWSRGPVGEDAMNNSLPYQRSSRNIRGMGFDGRRPRNAMPRSRGPPEEYATKNSWHYQQISTPSDRGMGFDDRHPTNAMPRSQGPREEDATNNSSAYQRRSTPSVRGMGFDGWRPTNTMPRSWGPQEDDASNNSLAYQQRLSRNARGRGFDGRHPMNAMPRSRDPPEEDDTNNYSAYQPRLSRNWRGMGFDGRRPVDARPPRSRPPPPPPHETLPLPPDASNTLYVEGLPPDITRREVAHIFRPFVGYKEVRLSTKESRYGYPLILCFAEFTNPTYAAAALNTLQGYEVDKHDPHSPYLRLKFSKNQSKGRGLLARDLVGGGKQIG